MKYQKTLGLEIHAQIDTVTKLFSRSFVNDAADANEQVDFLDAGYPGALPIPNEAAIFMALKTAIALNMEINQISIFDRKHYFYQDLPLGYQITQFYKPIGLNGYIDCSFGRVRINRLHIESDAGKSVYKDDSVYIDLNRAGVPLMEIVTEPDLHHEDEVIEFLKELRAILLAVKTSKCDMELGNFRADVNLSLAKIDESLGTRAEIKNLNSYVSIKKAIQYEAEFQEKILEAGGKINQETKLFDLKTGQTRSIRDKEDAHEYLYFPDPDLLPIYVSLEMIEDIKRNLPKLPNEMRSLLHSSFIPKEQSYTLTETIDRFEFTLRILNNFEKAMHIKIANWICSELLGQLAKINIDLDRFLKERKYFEDCFIEIIKLCETNQISRPKAKEILSKIIAEDEKFSVLAAKYAFLEKIDFDLDDMIVELLNSSNDEVEKYRNGKYQIVTYFVGQIMKKTKGQLDPKIIEERVLIELKRRS